MKLSEGITRGSVSLCGAVSVSVNICGESVDLNLKDVDDSTDLVRDIIETNADLALEYILHKMCDRIESAIGNEIGLCDLLWIVPIYTDPSVLALLARRITGSAGQLKVVSEPAALFYSCLDDFAKEGNKYSRMILCVDSWDAWLMYEYYANQRNNSVYFISHFRADKWRNPSALDEILREKMQEFEKDYPSNAMYFGVICQHEGAETPSALSRLRANMFAYEGSSRIHFGGRRILDLFETSRHWSFSVPDQLWVSGEEHNTVLIGESNNKLLSGISGIWCPLLTVSELDEPLVRIGRYSLSIGPKGSRRGQFLLGKFTVEVPRNEIFWLHVRRCNASDLLVRCIVPRTRLVTSPHSFRLPDCYFLEEIESCKI